MMERINRLRRDPRMVAPLSLIAVLVVAYALKQALAGPKPVSVRVQEVAPKVASSVTIPMATESASVEDRNPYFHPDLLKAERGVGRVAGEVPAGELGGLLPVQPAPSEGAGEAMTPPIAMKPPSEARGGGEPPPPVAETSGSDRLQQPPPQYRLVAVVLGSHPAALLVGPSGESLSVTSSDILPTGERVVRITDTYVALEAEACARILFLSEYGPPGAASPYRPTPSSATSVTSGERP